MTKREKTIKAVTDALLLQEVRDNSEHFEIIDSYMEGKRVGRRFKPNRKELERLGSPSWRLDGWTIDPLGWWHSPEAWKGVGEKLDVSGSRSISLVLG